MSQQPETAPKKRKQKNWAVIHGGCKMAPLSDGLRAMPCEKCRTVSKLRKCPFCGTKRAGCK